MRKVVLIYDKDAAWFAARLTGPYAFLTAETGAQALLLAPQAQILLALAPRVTPGLLAAMPGLLAEMPGLLAAMPGLEWVQALTTGTDTLAGLGVTVTSARGIHGPQMAELALVLMLSAARRFPATNGYPRTVIFYADRAMSVIEMWAFGAGRDLDGRYPVQRGVGRWRKATISAC